MFRSGFVAVIGRPNVGKSTLVNALVGSKAAIISDKPQTTRNQIHAVVSADTFQIIFVDTPGIHKPKHRLGWYMVRSARNTLEDVDLILFMVDMREPPGKGDRYIVDLLGEVDTPVFLVLNKKDLSAAEKVEELFQEYGALYPFEALFMVSALYGENVEKIIPEILNYLPEGPQYYPPDMITDRPEYFEVSELIREKVLHLTREEVPFSIAVDVEEMKPRETRELIDIRAVIYVERESQKGIIIGKAGEMLREIGSRARPEIENLLDSHVFLDLWVKVSPGWRNRERMLKNLGYGEE